MYFRNLISLIAMIAFFLPSPAIAQSRYVLLRTSPAENLVSNLPSSGWALTIQLISQGELGISKVPNEIGSVPRDRFPMAGQTGLLLYANPDGCPSWGSNSLIANFDCRLPRPWPVDEIYLQFSLDSDGPGMPDSAGSAELRRTLVDSSGNGGASWRFQGPATGGDTLDGYGFGADDDLPGLVILSDTGHGVVVSSLFDRPTPNRARNLAGFLSSVSYQLNDANKRTVVTAHLDIPRNLLNPVVLYDDCVSAIKPPVGDCGGADLRRVDGLPIGETNPSITTLRLFVINGIAPSVLSDVDGNGIIDAQDASLSGFSLISREAVVRFRQILPEECPYYGIPYDLDGNRRAPKDCNSSPGSVTLTKVPR